MAYRPRSWTDYLEAYAADDEYSDNAVDSDEQEDVSMRDDEEDEDCKAGDDEDEDMEDDHNEEDEQEGQDKQDKEDDPMEDKDSFTYEMLLPIHGTPTYIADNMKRKFWGTQNPLFLLDHPAYPESLTPREILLSANSDDDGDDDAVSHFSHDSNASVFYDVHAFMDHPWQEVRIYEWLHSQPDADDMATPTPPDSFGFGSGHDEESVRELAIDWMERLHADMPNGIVVAPPPWYSYSPTLAPNRPRAWIKDWNTGAVRPRRTTNDLVVSLALAQKGREKGMKGDKYGVDGTRNQRLATSASQLPAPLPEAVLLGLTLFRAPRHKSASLDDRRVVETSSPYR